MLEERDQSIALLSQMYNDQLAKLSEMMEKMEAEAKIRAQLEDQISENLALIDSYANPDNDHNFEVKNEEKETKQSEADKRRNKKKNKNKNKNRRLSVAAAKRKSTLEIPTLVSFFLFHFFLNNFHNQQIEINHSKKKIFF